MCLKVKSCCCDSLGAVSMGMGGRSNASWGDWRRAAAAGPTASGERASRWTRKSKLLLIVGVCARREKELGVSIEAIITL